MKAIPIIPIFAIALLLAYGFGLFSSSFQNGLCYTEVMNSVARLSKDVSEKGDSKLRSDFDAALEAIPMRGYETDCDEVERFWKGKESEFDRRISLGAGVR